MSITRALKRIALDVWSCRSPAAQARRDQEIAYSALVWVLTRSPPPLKGPVEVDDSNK